MHSGGLHQFTVNLSNDGLEHLDVSLCVEWIKVNVTVRSLTEDNLEHCAVALYKELVWGHMVMGEVSRASSWRPAA